ncbi:MAG: DUF3164 family protein [Nevskia sp.]|jgi:hypothetical protein|nr:DUF3164 family protein [Nevskia sp.]MCK9385071.1 DUF3164 family protein [Nevskia sp.]
MSATAPNGYWKDAQGRLVAVELIKPIDKGRDQLVRELIAGARDVSALIEKFKSLAFADIAAFVELSAEEYGAKIGGNKGNVTLITFDGSLKIVRQVQDTLVFDERLQAAKQLIDECVMSWGGGSDPKIMTLVNDAFQVGKEGRINTGRVLGLRRLDIRDSKWQQAMQAISDSVRVASSKPYVRFYERIGDSDQYRAISLDMAAL